jgi:DNA-binding transcriptional MerR regulator
MTMDTRILTLFDDDDFMPKPKVVKPTKKAAAPPAVKSDVESTAPSSTDSATEHTETPNNTTTAATHNIDSNKEDSSIITESNMDIVLENSAAGITTPEEEIQPDTTAAAHPEVLEDEIAHLDKALNDQLISELIQLDYSAFIHKDYPFDISQSSVVRDQKAIAETPSEEGSSHHQEIEKKTIATLPSEPLEQGFLSNDNLSENIDLAVVLTDTNTEFDLEDLVFTEVAPLPEWDLTKNYYGIGAVAEMFQVNTSHIRFWTTEFKMKTRTNRKGDRLYTPKDIADLRLIYHLVKEKKHTIKGAKEILKSNKNKVSQEVDLKEALTSLKNTLVQIKDKL